MTVRVRTCAAFTTKSTQKRRILDVGVLPMYLSMNGADPVRRARAHKSRGVELGPAPVERRVHVPPRRVGVLIVRDGRRDERRRQARDDDRRHCRRRARLCVVKQRDSGED